MRRSSGRRSSAASLLGLAAIALVLAGSRQPGGAEAPPPGARADGPPAFAKLGLGPVRVAIDIHPDKKRNPIHPGRWEFVPVAILGSPGFDVLKVDQATLAFGPNGAAPSQARSWRARDVNGDGHTDLVTFYRTRETGIADGDSQACLRGATVSGILFEGCDAVETARKKRTRVEAD